MRRSQNDQRISFAVDRTNGSRCGNAGTGDFCGNQIKKLNLNKNLEYGLRISEAWFLCKDLSSSRSERLEGLRKISVETGDFRRNTRKIRRFSRRRVGKNCVMS